MRNYFSYIILGIFLMSLLTSCYRDKGNYSYENLNEISIDLPDEVAVQQGMRLHLTPKLNFVLNDTEENLSYEWVISLPTSSDSANVVLSTDRDFSEQISYTSGNTYPFSFKVTDNNTGVTYRKGMNLQVMTNYQQGYFILEQYDNYSDISFYNTQTDSVYYHVFSTVNPDVTLKSNSTDFFTIDYNGYTIRIGDEQTKVTAGNLCMVFGEDWGYVLDYRSCEVLSDMEQMFSVHPDKIRPQVLAKEENSPNFYLMNDGKLHRMYQDKGQTAFGEVFMTSDDLETELAPFIGTGFFYRGLVGVLFFDQGNHRFYSTTPATNLVFSDVKSIYKKENKDAEGNIVSYDTLINAAKMDPDWELIGFSKGGMSKTYYYMVFRTVDKLYATTYAITGAGFSSGPLHVINEEECPGMRNSAVFMAPNGRAQLYYVNGNEIRLYDMSSNRSRVIYIFPAGEEVTALEFPTDNGLTLTASTWDGVKGSVYLFDLVNTGDLRDARPTAVKTNFGKIKKIVYKK